MHTLFSVALTSLVLTSALLGCDVRGDDGEDPDDPGAADSLLFVDVSDARLPAVVRADGFTMDARPADVDADGDLDLILAIEFGRNLLLVNDGAGRFAEADGAFPNVRRDSEDIAVADFDGDGDLDVVFVSEDDRTNEYYLNDGAGRFTDAPVPLPALGVTNAVAEADLDGDGDVDLLLGNNGQNVFLLNDGSGGFLDVTAERLPARVDATQDLALGDLDADGDLDMVVGNEDANRILVNVGGGVFRDAALPLRQTPEETRQVALGDVDFDGDLDVYFANVDAFVPGADPRNRLLLNDGRGVFTEAPDGAVPAVSTRSFDARFADLDGDFDLDLVVSDAAPGARPPRPFRAHLNDGTGRFEDATQRIFPETAVGAGFDAEAADFDGDGRLDLYLASRALPDVLLLGR